MAIRTINKRKTIPREVIKLAQEWSSSHIFANLEYEVDELRRDIDLCALAQEQDPDNAIEIVLEHDYLISVPGKVVTPKNTPYSVFSPFHRAWSAMLVKDLDKYSKEYPMPQANNDSVRSDKVLGKLFEDKVPEEVEGFELPSKEYADRVRALYPAGTEVAEQASFFIFEYGIQLLMLIILRHYRSCESLPITKQTSSDLSSLLRKMRIRKMIITIRV